MSVTSNGPGLQEYSAKNMPCNHWWRLPLYAEFIFCTLFKHLQKPSFIVDLWLPLENACTRIFKIPWKVFLNIPEKIPSSPITIIFGRPNGTKKFPKAYRTAWSNVIYSSLVAAPIPNTIIQSRHVSILRYPSKSRMSPSTQKYRNTTSNGFYELIVWSSCCASWEHKFTDWQCAQVLMNWATSFLTIGHQNYASILNMVICSWLRPANEDTCHD